MFSWFFAIAKIARVHKINIMAFLLLLLLSENWLMFNFNCLFLAKSAKKLPFTFSILNSLRKVQGFSSLYTGRNFCYSFFKDKVLNISKRCSKKDFSYCASFDFQFGFSKSLKKNKFIRIKQILNPLKFI